MTWLVWAGIIFILLIILFLTRIHIRIHYHHHRGDDLLVVALKVWGIPLYTYRVPVIAIQQDSATLVIQQKEQKPEPNQVNEKKWSIGGLIKKMKAMQHLLEHIAGFHRIMKRFLAKITVSQFQWRTRIGLGDAAWTGAATGIVWGVKGNLVSAVSRFMKLKADPEVSVEPLWQGTHSETDMTCMISFRIGQAMRAGLQIVKLWKGRRPS